MFHLGHTYRGSRFLTLAVRQALFLSRSELLQKKNIAFGANLAKSTATKQAGREERINT